MLDEVPFNAVAAELGARPARPSTTSAGASPTPSNSAIFHRVDEHVEPLDTGFQASSSAGPIAASVVTGKAITSSGPGLKPRNSAPSTKNPWNR